MQKLSWWQQGIIYEVYPRSFQDSNGDGIGDLNGIRSRLDYIKNLGVDAIWISPVYPSPMADFGYDVADYCAIDPLFGSMDDFDLLLKEVHDKGLRMVLDFVPNHTSDQHPWFVESRSSRTSDKRDWYLWRDEPNNWMSNFGGSGWQFEEQTEQYYYHSFLKQQPDLNWRNPQVRQAMYAALRFWLEKGVDGFRIDVMWLMIKDDQYRDNPPNPGYHPGGSSSHRFLPVYNSNRPEVHAIVAEMRAVIDGYSERVLIGEIYLPVQQLMAYYGSNLEGANLPFNFQLLQCPWSANAVADALSAYEAALPEGAWPNWVLGNHDNARIATRVGVQQAPVAAMLLMTLPGTLTIYYGEELGMVNVVIPPEAVQDPAEKNEPGIGMGRDPERTPMQWNSSLHAGFTTGQPWLPLATDYATLNVAALDQQDSSILQLYRHLIRLRRDYPTLIDGSMTAIGATDGVLCFKRSSTTESLLVLLNMRHDAVEVSSMPGSVLLSTSLKRQGDTVGASILLDPSEGLLVKLQQG